LLFFYHKISALKVMITFKKSLENKVGESTNDMSIGQT